MQNLIPGNRYYVTHPSGMWSGECTYLSADDEDFRISDVVVKTGGTPGVMRYFTGEAYYRLNVKSDWSWKELNICLENK